MKYKEALLLWGQRKFPDRKVIHVSLDVNASTDYGCCDECSPYTVVDVEAWVTWEDDSKPRNPGKAVPIYSLDSFLTELFDLTEEKTNG